MQYSIDEVVRAVATREAVVNSDKAVVSTLLIDSRSLSMPSETLFFALRTSQGDGHRYVEELYARGVRNFVVESLKGLEVHRDANYLVVGNTLAALQQLAGHHRSRFAIPVIAVAGTLGKTYLKEWLNQLLSPDYRIERSPRSYNSQIGVALSLWNITSDTTLAIIEAGISLPGEMQALQRMIKPTMAVMTNVGEKKGDCFKSIDEKVDEQLIIAKGCPTVIYAGDDERMIAGAERMGLRLTRLKQAPTCPPSTPVYLDNARTCAAVMESMGYDHATIEQRIARLKPVDTRINVIEGVNNCTIIADGYPSDYNSLEPALDFVLRRTGSRPNTVIMSDMIDAKESDYALVAHRLAARKVSRLIAVGPAMCSNAHHFKGLNAMFFGDAEQLCDEMSQGDFENETILVKTSPRQWMEQILDILEVKHHQTVEEVDLNALAHNFKFFKSLVKPSTKTVAMVKASGYGAGSYELAKTLQDRGADYLAVAVQDEGVELRRAGITMPIIVLNPSVVNYKAIFRYSLEPEVYSIDECRQLIKEGARCGARQHAVHIKLDTGMHRLGFTLEQLPELIELLKSQDVLRPVSMFSHLCVADEPDQDAYTQQQIDYFVECSKLIQSHFEHHIMRHILNTSGIVRFPQYQFDMVRIGIGLYGIKTVMDGSEDTLQPVSALKSVIISIKEWPAGTTIGYGRRGVLTRDSRIATVTLGYADGLDRHAGNGRTCMWAGGKRCPTVGNVCMDAVMIDITGTDCQVGDRVEIFGPHIPVEELSEARGTIPYEVLTSVSPRVKRVYYRE